MKKRLFDISIILTLVVCAFAVYSNTFDASFHYDDFHNVVYNERIHMEAFGWERLINSYDPSYPFDRQMAYMSFALNYYFGGLDVFGYHLVNIIIHILTGIGVYFLVKGTMELVNPPSPPFAKGGIEDVSLVKGWAVDIPLWKRGIKGDFVAALAALLWLLSPVQTQAVTYIVQRMASMAAMFYVWSFLCYIKGRTSGGGKRWGYLTLSLILFLHALGTKQNTVTLPFMILLYEVAFFRKGPFNILKEKRFYISVLAGVSMVAGYLYIFRESFDLPAYFGMGFGIRERLFTEGRVATEHYLPTLFFPIPSRLALIHDFPLSRGLLSPFTTLPSILFIAGAMALSFYKFRSAPLIPFFALWFFINLIPESILMGLDLIHDHRLYLPSIGFYAVVAWVAVRIWETGRWRRLSTGLIVLALASFSINTFNRNRVWHDEVSLWSDNIKKAPELSASHEGLGIAYLKEGELEKAEGELKIAKKLNPFNPFAISGLAAIFSLRGDTEGAIRELEYLAERRRLGVSFYGGVDKVFYSLGNDLFRNGRSSDAERVFRLGLEAIPESRILKSAMNELERRLPE